MSEPNKKYTTEQFLIVTEFAEYGIEPDDIIFYSDKPEPFFTYEATAALCNHLTDIKDIEPEPIAWLADTTSVRCKFTFEDGKTRSGIGIVNHNELIDGAEMKDAQRFALASARAIRNALKASGINLLKAHYQLRATGELAEPTLDLLRVKLLAEVHTLGKEIGFIISTGNKGELNKTAWYNLIFKRYGKNSSGELTEQQLADFAAFLRSCLNQAA
jgi:hypothetical protein